MPAATILLDAYRRIESATVPAAVIQNKMFVEQMWVQEAMEGRWFGVGREAAQAFIVSVARHVTGTVKYQLTPGVLELRSLRAEKALYVRSRETL